MAASDDLKCMLQPRSTHIPQGFVHMDNPILQLHFIAGQIDAALPHVVVKISERRRLYFRSIGLPEEPIIRNIAI